jgi:hypothetical protein
MGFPEYHKIHSLYMRDEHTKLIRPGEYARPEFGYLAGLDWLWTEKVDGTNVRIGLDDGAYRVGGKTDNASMPVPLLESIAAMGLEARIRTQFPDGNVVLYGEGYGPKIQSGGKYRADPSFVLFDVLVGRWWLQRNDVVEVAGLLGIDVVPLVMTGTITGAENMVRGAGFASRWGSFEAEGLVGTPAVPLFARNGERVVVKLKTVDYRKLAAANTRAGAATP